jgi:hypothetical protein
VLPRISIAFPALKEGQQEMVCLNSACRAEEKPEDLPPALAFELDPVNRIEVPEELIKPHPMVRATAGRLRAAKVG